MADQCGGSCMSKKRYLSDKCIEFNSVLGPSVSKKRRFSDKCVEFCSVQASELNNCTVTSSDEDGLSETDDIVDSQNSSEDSNYENEDDSSVHDNYSPSWSDDASVLKSFPFSKENKLLVPIPGKNEPADYFRLLVDDVFLEEIVKYTNMYAEEYFLSGIHKENSRINQWKDLTTSELKLFLGILLHTGTIIMPRIQDYWKTDNLFLSCFPQYMSRDRFLLILRFLHFCKNPKANEPQPEDRLYKIRSVVDYFNNKMLVTYYPGQELSIDEAMMLWRGRLHFRQYIKGKKHKYGIKLYILTEPNSLALKTLVYTGKHDELGGKGHASNVVNYLMNEKLHNGHSLYMDNYYNSHNLSKNLLRKKTYTTGTLRSNRINTPDVVSSAKLRKGETTSKYSDEGVMIGKWHDKRDVGLLYISTQHKNTMADFINKTGENKKKPLPILQYNCYMAGVDRKDQMMAYYPCERKTLRWYKKLFIHYFQLLLLNSYFLYNKHTIGKKMNLYDFRLVIIRELLSSKPTERCTTSPKNLHVSPSVNHLPSKCEFGASGRTLRKKCKQCKKSGLREDTTYHCETCPGKPGLCLEPCFKIYHK